MTPWTEEETESLRKGVSWLGVGNWAAIRWDPRFSFNECRSADSLRDKWRRLGEAADTSSRTEVVWGRLKGCPWWPGYLAEPLPVHLREKPGNDAELVAFFGPKVSVAWLGKADIVPYVQRRGEFVARVKSAGFLKAVAEADGFAGLGSEEVDVGADREADVRPAKHLRTEVFTPSSPPSNIAAGMNQRAARPNLPPLTPPTPPTPRFAARFVYPSSETSSGLERPFELAFSPELVESCSAFEPYQGTRPVPDSLPAAISEQRPSTPPRPHAESLGTSGASGTSGSTGTLGPFRWMTAPWRGLWRSTGPAPWSS